MIAWATMHRACALAPLLLAACFSDQGAGSSTTAESTAADTTTGEPTSSTSSTSSSTTAPTDDLPRDEPYEGEALHAFVTIGKFAGNLNLSTDDPDEICEDEAKASNLTGKYRSWISLKPTAPPSEEFDVSDLPYVRTDGRLVALKFEDLRLGKLVNPIDLTAGGSQLEPPAICGDVWTATEVDGASNDNCGLFLNASADAIGLAGSSIATDSKWTAACLVPCSAKLRLYCFEQAL